MTWDEKNLIFFGLIYAYWEKLKDLLNLALVNGRNLTLAFKQISTDLLLLLLTVIKITHSYQCVHVMTVFVSGQPRPWPWKHEPLRCQRQACLAKDEPKLFPLKVALVGWRKLRWELCTIMSAITLSVLIWWYFIPKLTCFYY